MRAYFIRAGDGQAIVEPKDAAMPEPGPQQMRVRIRAAGLNRGEFMGAGPTAKPAGTDAAGEVEKLGPGVVRPLAISFRNLFFIFSTRSGCSA